MKKDIKTYPCQKCGGKTEIGISSGPNSIGKTVEKCTSCGYKRFRKPFYQVNK